MTQKGFVIRLFSLAVIILAALLYVRLISDGFVLGTDTFSHPYKSFVAALIFAGLAWVYLIPVLKGFIDSSGKYFWALAFLGVILRVIFFGSTPIYEDDWNRYLWDGVVTKQGTNPYQYPPEATFAVRFDAPQELKDLQVLSVENGNFTTRINNPHLTTIYPPVAMGVFTLAAVIKPFSLDAMRGIYLIAEIAALWLLIKILIAYGREPFWALLYWLNPMLIYSVYNAGHMDILLVPLLIGALYLAKQRPLWASFTLGLAAAVKIWPLILGPVLLRNHRSSLPTYFGGGLIMGLTALLLLSPMLLSLGETSGLQAYAGGWQRSSFIFGYLEAGLALISDNAGRLARVLIAGVLTSLALWFAFKRGETDKVLPAYLMLIPLWLYLLSPTGYPWYILWFLPFLPFLPLYGAAILTVMVSLYYLRFAMGERDIYDVYTSYLIPLQFGLPLIILLWELYALRKRPNV
jgi:hypothetical protein